MLKEFREFALKGNVVDLAVGVIIGAAFGKIVDSLVTDIIMPVVGLVFGKLDFSNLYVVLGTIPPNVANNLADLKKAGVPVLAYGNFITIALNFVILAFIIFLMVKQINKLKKAEPAPQACSKRFASRGPWPAAERQRRWRLSRISRSRTMSSGGAAGAGAASLERRNLFTCLIIRKITNARITKLTAMVMKLP